MKEVNTHNFWFFELDTQEGLNVLIWIIVGSQQRERQDSQNPKMIFFRPPVTSAQYHISTEKCPYSVSLLNYNGDDYSQGYGQIKEVF